MKIFVIGFGLLFVSCYQSVQNTARFQDKNELEKEVYSELTLEAGKLTLFNLDGRCTLRFESNVYPKNQGKTETDIGMTAPCNFIRKPGGDRAPLYYSYKKGIDRRTVLLVVGGPPDPSAKDEFLPNGCGTLLTQVRVYADRIELGHSGKTGIFPICPSQGEDEVYFGS